MCRQCGEAFVAGGDGGDRSVRVAGRMRGTGCEHRPRPRGISRDRRPRPVFVGSAHERAAARAGGGCGLHVPSRRAYREATARPCSDRRGVVARGPASGWLSEAAPSEHGHAWQCAVCRPPARGLDIEVRESPWCRRHPVGCCGGSATGDTGTTNPNPGGNELVTASGSISTTPRSVSSGEPKRGRLASAGRASRVRCRPCAASRRGGRGARRLARDLRRARPLAARRRSVGRARLPSRRARAASVRTPVGRRVTGYDQDPNRAGPHR